MDGPVESIANETTTLYRGNCIDILKEHVSDNSVNLIFADPPYNIGKNFGDFHDKWCSDEEYAAWCFEWLDLCLSKLCSNGSMYLMTSTQAMPLIDVWLRKRCHILSRIIWHYDSSGVQAKRFYGSLYEPILFVVKDAKNYVFNSSEIEVEAKTGSIRGLIDYRKTIPQPYKSTKVPGNVWYYPRVRYRMDEYENHPTQKPEKLLERVILASSKIGDVVLDPFSGTFTTCAVAKRLGRRSIGIELNSDYFKIGIRRCGLASFYNGEQLSPLDKKYYRKNGKLGKSRQTQRLLFDE